MFEKISSFAAIVGLGLCVLAVSSCAPANTVYAVASGSHAPMDKQGAVGKRVVVWSNHAGVGNAIIALYQNTRHTVVERARLRAVFNEQGIRLTHTPDDEADVLRVGKLIGADQVIFAEATQSSEVRGGSYYYRGSGSSNVWTQYNLSVAVRSVIVETGKILWSGEAHYPEPITNPEEGLIILTHRAIQRALCLVEEGYEWRNDSDEGCVKKEGTPNLTTPRQPSTLGETYWTPSGLKTAPQGTRTEWQWIGPPPHPKQSETRFEKHSKVCAREAGVTWAPPVLPDFTVKQAEIYVACLWRKGWARLPVE